MLSMTLPQNMGKWLKNHNGVNVAINWNHADGDHGYAHMIWHTVVVSMMTRTCQRCGYDLIWNPDDTDSKCNRHTYGAWRYDTVFVWSEKSSMSLEDAFDDWLSSQGEGAVVSKHYGQLGWR